MSATATCNCTGGSNVKLKRILSAIALSVALALFIPATVTLTGCAGSTAAVAHPGQINAVDGQLFDALVTIQAGIEVASTEFSANPTAKPLLNKIRAAYTDALHAYQAYHKAAVSNPAQEGAIQQQIVALNSQLAAVNQVKP